MILAGLIFGLAGSLHCVGMCGPLVMGVPGLHSKGRMALNQAAYHSGRILTYMIMGMIISLAGVSAALIGAQQYLSIALGVITLIWLASYKGWIPRMKGNSMLKNKVIGWMGKYIKSDSTGSMFMLGSMNGLLPCGLVLAALIFAASATTATEGMSYMLAFGAGTAPALIGLSFLRKLGGSSIASRFKTVSTFLIAGMAFLLILRGLNLGIPMISPQLEVTEQQEVVNKCCELK